MTMKNIFYNITIIKLHCLFGGYMKFIRFLVLLFVIIGALNWGLWGFFQYDVIQDIVGSNSSALARIIYSIIGLAGVYGISFFFAHGIYGGCCKKEPKEPKE